MGVVHVKKIENDEDFLKEGKLSKVLADSVRFIADAFRPKLVWFSTFDRVIDELKRLDGGNIEPDEVKNIMREVGIKPHLELPLGGLH